MKTFTLLCLITLFSTIFLFGQVPVQTYQMKALGRKIGTATVSTQIEGEHIYYHSKSVLKVNLLVKKIHMEINNKTHYLGGKLQSSDVRVFVNGKLHTSSLIKWLGKKYLIRIDEEEKSPIDTSVRFSGTLLYFQEPLGITEAFSESSGLFMPIKNLGKGNYEVTDPRNERKMGYVYQNGLLTQLNIRHPLLTISMHLVK